METAIGVFASRDTAEESVKELLQRGVPESSLVFLTRSESEAKTVGKQLGAFAGGFVGGAAGMTAGVAAATLLLPGIGAVFALGFGAAALLGLAGAGAGASTGSAIAHEGGAPKPTADQKASDDASFFREVLKEGRSLVVVRTESQEIATTACAILDRRALSMEGHAPIKMTTVTRQIGNVFILDVSGRITLGEGNVMLREIVRDLAEKGANKIVMNLGDRHTCRRQFDGQRDAIQPGAHLCYHPRILGSQRKVRPSLAGAGDKQPHRLIVSGHLGWGQAPGVGDGE